MAGRFARSEDRLLPWERDFNGVLAFRLVRWTSDAEQLDRLLEHDRITLGALTPRTARQPDQQSEG